MIRLKLCFKQILETCTIFTNVSLVLLLRFTTTKRCIQKKKKNLTQESPLKFVINPTCHTQGSVLRAFQHG